jgi:hypothetical protein
MLVPKIVVMAGALVVAASVLWEIGGMAGAAAQLVGGLVSLGGLIWYVVLRLRLRG